MTTKQPDDVNKFIEWVINSLLNINERSSFHINRLVIYCKNDGLEKPMKLIEEKFLITKQCEFFISSYNKQPGNLVLSSTTHALLPFPIGITENTLVQQINRDFNVFAKNMKPYFYIEIVFTFDSYDSRLTGPPKHFINKDQVNSKFQSDDLDFLLIDVSHSCMRLGLFNKDEFSELCTKNKATWITKFRNLGIK